MKKITVEFLTDYPPYNKGEQATFFEREAQKLIDRGFAQYIGGDKNKESQADRLKALRAAPETRHIPGPKQTKSQTTKQTKSGRGRSSNK